MTSIGFQNEMRNIMIKFKKNVSVFYTEDSFLIERITDAY